MGFHPWQTMLDECRVLIPEAKNMPLQMIAAANRRKIHEYPFTFECNRKHHLLRNESELAWARSGRPFYNLHPSLVPAIARTNLETHKARRSARKLPCRKSPVLQER
jgi:hypothetical protein